jgi:CheY-like chemotaxis protein
LTTTSGNVATSSPSLALGHAECELATGELEAAEERLGWLMSRAWGFLDQAAVVCAQATAAEMRSEFVRGLELLLGALARAGIELPHEPSEESVHLEHELLRTQLGDRSVESLIDLGEADASVHALMELMYLLVGTASMSNDRLMRLAACRLAILSLERGHCDASALAYVHVGQMLGPYFGDYDLGFRFARLGLTLLERRRQSRFRERVLVLTGGVVYPWTQPFPEAAELLRRGCDAALANGDPTLAWGALAAQVSHGLFSGAPLAEVTQLCQRATDLVHQASLGAFFKDTSISCERLVRTLRGLTPHFPSFDEAGFDEVRVEAHLASSPALAVAHGWYWIRKLEARYHGGDYAGALAAGARAEPLLWTTGFAIERVVYHLYRALALAAHFEAGTAEERTQHRAALGEHARALAVWGRSCPANFSASAALVAAEIARIDGSGARGRIPARWSKFRQSGGHVAVDSEVGRGTTFRIYLPRCGTPADELIEASSPSASISGYGTETILLVEDDEQVRNAVCMILQQRGYNVLDAAGPGDAILISEQHPGCSHLLLSDVVMPLMTGVELAGRVLVARPTIRLLFISGYIDAPIPRLVLGDYRVDCLQKPFTPAALIQNVRQVLDLQNANGAHRSG